MTLLTPFGQYFFDTFINTLYINSLRPQPNRRHFADIFRCIFENENEWISSRNSLNFVLKVRTNNIPALVHIMAWRRPGNKPLSEPMVVSLLTHICVTRPQWVNNGIKHQYIVYIHTFDIRFKKHPDIVEFSFTRSSTIHIESIAHSWLCFTLRKHGLIYHPEEPTTVKYMSILINSFHQSSTKLWPQHNNEQEKPVQIYDMYCTTISQHLSRLMSQLLKAFPSPSSSKIMFNFPVVKAHHSRMITHFSGRFIPVSLDCTSPSKWPVISFTGWIQSKSLPWIITCLKSSCTCNPVDALYSFHYFSVPYADDHIQPLLPLDGSRQRDFVRNQRLPRRITTSN